jgi:hypothetical protein
MTTTTTSTPTRTVEPTNGTIFISDEIRTARNSPSTPWRFASPTDFELVAWKEDPCPPEWVTAVRWLDRMASVALPREIIKKSRHGILRFRSAPSMRSS